MALQTCYKCGSVLPPGCEACPNCGAPAPWSDDEISALSSHAPQAPATVYMPSAPAVPDYTTPVPANPDYGSETRPIGAVPPSDLSLNEEVLRPQHNAPEPVAAPAPAAPRASGQRHKPRVQKKKKKQNSTSQLVITLTVLVVIVMLLLIFFTGSDPDTVPVMINGLNML